MSEQPHRVEARALGGPLDGTTLGDDSAERYVVSMADGTCHVYDRTDRRVADGRLYDYAGRD